MYSVQSKREPGVEKIAPAIPQDGKDTGRPTQHQRARPRLAEAWKETRLLAACKDGDVSVAEAMIFHGARVDCRDTAGLTPLHIAARSGNLALARLLLDGCANPKKTDQALFGKTPARIARDAGFFDVARLIEAGIREDRLTKRGMMNEEIDLLFGDNPDRKALRAYLQFPKYAARRQSLALKIAATSGNQRLMQTLIGIGVPVNRKMAGGKTALHYAARAGDASLVRWLLECGADPELRSGAGSTALDYACRCGSPQVVEQLLEHGVRLTGQGWFSRKTIKKFADKGWLARPVLRALVIDQLDRYYQQYRDRRVAQALTEFLPSERESGEEVSNH